MKKVLFIVCTHGDEGYSIDVIKRIQDRYNPDEFDYDWVVGNPHALAAGARYTDIDMNRIAPGDKDSDKYEMRRVAELVEMAAGYECVIDIHGSNSACGLTTLIPKPTKENLALAAAFPAEKHIIWYSENSIVNGPLAQHMPVPAIELECGYKQNPEIAEGLYGMLSTFIEMRKNGAAQTDTVNTSYYDVYGKIMRDETNKNLQFVDFELSEYEGEHFLPYMAGSYQDKYVCYKLRAITYDALREKYQNIT